MVDVKDFYIDITHPNKSNRLRTLYLYWNKLLIGIYKEGFIEGQYVWDGPYDLVTRMVKPGLRNMRCKHPNGCYDKAVYYLS